MVGSTAGGLSSLFFLGDVLPEGITQIVTSRPDEMVVANLESAFSSAIVDSRKAHSLVADMALLQRGVSLHSMLALSVANNHVYDAGDEAFAKAIDLVRRNITTHVFGLRESPYIDVRVNGVRTAVIGCLESCSSRGSRIFPEEAVVDLISSLVRSHDRIVVYPHWGKESEYIESPTPQQIRRGEEWLGAGASAVLGHHPHVIQCPSRTARGVVVYSLGNAWFEHSEGSQYPGTATGLCAIWRPGEKGDSSTDRWSLRSFKQPLVASADDEGESRVGNAMEFDANAPQVRTWIGWGRSAGSIYFAKSKNSWSARLKKHPFYSLPRWIAWHMLPRTWLIRLGAWIGRHSHEVEA